MNDKTALIEFANHWLDTHPKKPNKGERRIIREFAQIITELMQVNKEQKDKEI